jgi:Abnormal spindle-like microcephaly-assoc'd, ASPM-SPD-2-Hydin
VVASRWKSVPATGSVENKTNDIIFAFQDFSEQESPCGRDGYRMVNRISRWSRTAYSTVSILAVSVELMTGCSSSVTGSKSVPPTVGTITSNNAAINFSPTQVGATATQKVTLSASGSSVTVTAAQVTGAGFTLVSSTLPSTLSSGQSLVLTVQFAPQTAGQLNGSLIIASNASNATLTVALSGSGMAAVAGTIAANSATVNFGSVEVGSTATQNVTLSVSGAPITVTSAQVSGAGFTVAPPVLPSTLSPGQSLVLAVGFAPQAAGQLGGSLVIGSNASNPTLTLALSGSGTAAPAHSATVSWASGDPAAVAYLVFRSDVSGGPYLPLTASLLTELSYTDSTVSSGSTYFYVVTELDAAGDESPFSSEVSATVP